MIILHMQALSQFKAVPFAQFETKQLQAQQTTNYQCLKSKIQPYQTQIQPQAECDFGSYLSFALADVKKSITFAVRFFG
ncbi:MAG: hypothetical protein RLZZ262_261 [Bacteroidota bacterium]|jgi:hypothetical protein